MTKYRAGRVSVLGIVTLVFVNALYLDTWTLGVCEERGYNHFNVEGSLILERSLASPHPVP